MVEFVSYMTYEEVKEFFNKIPHHFDTLEEAKLDQCRAVINNVLEKQIPKRHKMVDNRLYCPYCEALHGYYGDIRIPVGSKYCPYCGSGIDWSEEE